MKGLAFITDPDGYWIEVLSPNTLLWASYCWDRSSYWTY